MNVLPRWKLKRWLNYVTIHVPVISASEGKQCLRCRNRPYSKYTHHSVVCMQRWPQMYLPSLNARKGWLHVNNVTWSLRARRRGWERWRETFSYVLYLYVLRLGIDLCHFDKIFPQGLIKQSSLSLVFFSPVPALMLSVNVVLGLTWCGCPCCSLQNSTFEEVC